MILQFIFRGVEFHEAFYLIGYSADLLQGGLEIPCMYRFTGIKNSVKKAHYRLNEEQDGLSEIEGTYAMHFRKCFKLAFFNCKCCY